MKRFKFRYGRNVYELTAGIARGEEAAVQLEDTGKSVLVQRHGDRCEVVGTPAQRTTRLRAHQI